MIIHCPHCDAELPPNSQFCPTCGRAVPQPATGATQQLREPEQGVRCSRCDALNPPGAQFCATCGTPLNAAAPVYAPVNPSIPVAEAPNLVPTVPHTPLPQAPQNRSRSALSPAVPGALFLFGLAILAWTGWWWPGILVLVGLIAVLGSVAANKGREGLVGGFWLLGLAVIAQFGWWWPGILVLVGLSALVGGVVNTSKRSGRRA